MQAAFHGNETDTIQRLPGAARVPRAFLPLLLSGSAVSGARWPFFPRYASGDSPGWLLRWPIFALGANFYPFFFPHYIAAVTCLFVLAARDGPRTAEPVHHPWMASGPGSGTADSSSLRARIFCSGTELICSIISRSRWRSGNTRPGTSSITATRGARLPSRGRWRRLPGKQLVFVRYWPQHIFQNEWVYNAADIDGAQRGLGSRPRCADENDKLRLYYPDRTAWLLEPDASPPKLSPYPLDQAAHGEASP